MVQRLLNFKISFEAWLECKVINWKCCFDRFRESTAPPGPTEDHILITWGCLCICAGGHMLCFAWPDPN